jgi:hypothetical protein
MEVFSTIDKIALKLIETPVWPDNFSASLLAKLLFGSTPDLSQTES